MTTSTQRALRLAFIGGSLDSAVGYTHYCASRLDGAFSIVAGAFSPEHASNRTAAEHYGVVPERTYADWKRLLEQEQGEIDAVAILTPMPDHRKMVCQALTLGIPVICEKPLALSSAECEQIRAVQQENKGYLAVTYNYSGFPMVRELRGILQRGDLGEIRQVHIEMPQDAYLRATVTPQKWRQQDYVIPTVSLDLGAHVYHLAHFLTGSVHPDSVLGRESTHGRFPELVDTVSCLAGFPGGIDLNAWWSKAALGDGNGLKVRVFCSRGSAEWVQAEPEYLWIAGPDGGKHRMDRGCSAIQIANEPRYTRFKAGHPAGFIEAFANVYQDIAAQLRAQHAGRVLQNHYVQGIEHSVACLQFLEAVSRSARQQVTGS